VQRFGVAVACALVVGGVASVPAGAQMLGVPVLQNAFSNPGVTVAANFGSGDDATTYGAAASWAPTSGRVQLSGGLGLFDPDGGDSRVTLGLRAAGPLPLPGGLSAAGFGASVFGGVGGARVEGATVLRVPLGVGLGYRRALGTRRGISGYVTPFYSWTRISGGGASASGGVFRVSFGADIAVLPELGVTVGYETGAEADAGDPGPTGGLLGIGLSYALRRSR